MIRKGRVLVIGGTGHIGSFLVPMLVSEGYEVVVLTRGLTQPFPHNFLFSRVSTEIIDRYQDEQSGRLQNIIKKYQPEAIIDLICFEPQSADYLIELLSGSDALLLSCGTAWVYGPVQKVPVDEGHPRNPLNDYARKKALIEEKLFQACHAGKFPVVLIHPGHITGAGKTLVTPFGDHNPETLQKIINGEEIFLLDGGFSTLHHVHPFDVAQLFVKALKYRKKAIGESFNCGASHAMTFYGMGVFFASLFGKELRFRCIQLEEYTEQFGFPEEAYYHVRQGCCMSIEKARELLDFQPAYSPEQAIIDATNYLLQQGVLKVKNNE
ncbi:NAD-dependent epimerase/dehydratase family protein [Atrimonas thermophila]|uniref:NAD-dependent epimerase/dehydratase family protein n=1 Tax=Atrimonas thermophila TaxID=3064161 RepID=UPI00399CE5FA